MTYTIIEAAKATNTTPSMLRVWESRYGWPKPLRQIGNHYRAYSDAQVEEIRRVVRAVKMGRSIGELIVDGEPILPWPDATNPQAVIAHLKTLINDIVAVLNVRPDVYLSERGRVEREVIMRRVRAFRSGQYGAIIEPSEKKTGGN